MNLFARENRRIRRLSRPKGQLAAALLSLVLVSCVPQKAMAEAKNELPVSPNAVHSFQESLTSGLEGGLRLSFDSFLLEADGKKQGAANSLSAEGGSLAIHMNGLSLHSLGLDLSLPLGYNGVHRELDLTLVNDMVYFAIENLDDPASYTFRYKADLSPFDSPIDERSIDPLTGGVYQYEYGELDYLIDDIIGILTDGESLSTPSFSNDSSLDFQEILSSIEEVIETSRNGNPYFIWNLPLGDGVLPLGFAGDGSYRLKGIDLPAKEEDGSQSSYELKKGVRLSFSASLEALPEDYVFSAPLDEEAYYPLVNSTAIFEKIARYAKKKFSLKAYRDASLSEEGLLLEHHEDAYVSETEKNYPAIEESLIAKISANVNLEDGSFHSLGASLDLIGESSHQYLDFHILDQNGYTGYLDLNGVLKANTTKSVLDGLIANIEEFANDPEIANGNLNDLFGSFAGTGNILDNVLNSQAISQLNEEGTYSGLISSLTRLSGSDDILIEVNTAPFGLSGALTILLEGQLPHLAAITFTDFTFGGFAFTGTLIVDEYEEEDFDPSDYKTMSHLPGISEQMADLFHSKSASFSLEGYVLDADDTSGEPDETYKIDGKAINQTGFTFSGSAMFNLVEKMGGGSLKIVDRKPEYTNDHHVSIFIEGPESEQEKEDMTEDWSANKTSAANNMLFSYDSKNDSVTNRDGKHPRTQPSGSPISVRFSIHSLNGILQVLGDLMSSPDERISSLFEGMLSTSGVSLLSKLQNRELAPILSNGILVAAELGSAKDHFEISKDLLGTAGNIILNLYYQNADSGLSAIEFSTVMANTSGEASKLIYAKITIDDLNTVINKETIMAKDAKIASLINNRDASSTYDLSSLKSLIEYLAGSLTIGQDASKKNTYHISGTVELSLGITITVDFWISVTGRQLKIFGNLAVPIIATGINSPASLHLVGGNRYTSFYYYNSGSELNGGSVYIRRVDIYSDKLSALTHQVKMSGNQFKENMVGWITQYMLGIKDSLLNIGSLGGEAQSIHFEDVLNSISYKKNADSLQWTFDLNVGELAHTDMLGNLDATITAKEVNANGGKEKTLTALDGTLGLNILFDSLLTAGIHLKLKNVESGTYQDCWNDSANQYYITSKKILFVTTYSLNTETASVSSFYDNRFYNSQTGAYGGNEYYGGATATGTPGNYY